MHSAMMGCLKLLFLSVLISNSVSKSAVSEKNSTFLYQGEVGDLNFAFLVHNCNASITITQQSLINSAIWITNRLNFLMKINDLNETFSITVQEVCTEANYYDLMYDLWKSKKYFVGLITTGKLSEKVRKFGEVLDFRNILEVSNVMTEALVKASIGVLSVLDWTRNVTIVAPTLTIAEEFKGISRSEWICVENVIIYKKRSGASVFRQNSSANGNYVVFGDMEQFDDFNLKQYPDDCNTIFVPLDGTSMTGFPLNSYVIQAPQFHASNSIIPTPLLFDIAGPLLKFAHNYIQRNNTGTKQLSPEEMVDFLKIEPLKSQFVYNIFKIIDNSTCNKSFVYNVFGSNLTILDWNLMESENLTATPCEICQECRNFFDTPFGTVDAYRIRDESWVFAFLAIALLGLLFCVAILMFVVVAICRGDRLEGNPVMTLLLLLSIMLMLLSVIPMCFEGTPTNNNKICSIRSLSMTLSYALSFSLILSRSILLATASKELGFMAHIAGPVQAFLALFIFGVQPALSLQVFFSEKCESLTNTSGPSYFFIVYHFSYCAMLLLLQLCLCPLIVKSERNYREGKYFAIATVVIVTMWLVWIGSFVSLGGSWREPCLCFGLVSTAGVLLACIFVPRTYVMAIAQARNKITSTLPSVSTATMDLYRAGGQPVYDCVNVAAINAIAVARASIAGQQQPDLYSCPNLPEDDDYEEDRCESPANDDKVTRF